ncbi:MAG: hypothetical protein Q7J54_04745 [Candidatus Woesearchaeota archaeon]|nr:hypothetical protein [Candidatus Woesearchaeota archaeon]
MIEETDGVFAQADKINKKAEMTIIGDLFYDVVKDGLSKETRKRTGVEGIYEIAYDHAMSPRI